MVAVGSIYSPKFIELGGDAANGVYTQSNFFPEEPRPEVKAFVDAFRAKYRKDPDDFNAIAYDGMIFIGRMAASTAPAARRSRRASARSRTCPAWCSAASRSIR